MSLSCVHPGRYMSQTHRPLFQPPRTRPVASNTLRIGVGNVTQPVMPAQGKLANESQKIASPKAKMPLPRASAHRVAFRQMAPKVRYKRKNNIWHCLTPSQLV